MASLKLVAALLALLLRISLLGDAAAGVALAMPLESLADEAAVLEKRQSTIQRYCDPSAGGLCWIEMYRSTALPRFRVAFPDAYSAPFDALLQIISPIAVGWAGFCWGGRMVNNPLTVAWQNNQNVTISSRWATGRMVPTVYNQAQITPLSQFVNSTHWTVELLCSGCSRWSGGALQPNEYNGLAWALSTTKPVQPSNPNSNFAIHQNVGTFSTQLQNGRNSASTFQAYVRSKGGR